MKRIDTGKTSLVEFMAAIKFAGDRRQSGAAPCRTHFAGFDQRARAGYPFSQEDSQLIRSAN